MKTQEQRLLRAIDTDRSAYERSLLRAACTESNEDLRAVLARMKHRASLYSLKSELPPVATDTGED